MVINRARKWHINKNGVYHHWLTYWIELKAVSVINQENIALKPFYVSTRKNL
jgi:hypothetical protein